MDSVEDYARRWAKKKEVEVDPYIYLKRDIGNPV